MIWNTATQRLEFEDGTPVGAIALNTALESRGQRARKDHLVETSACQERRVTEAEQGRKRMVRKRDRKNLYQRTNDDLCKKPAPRAGIFDTDYFE